MPHDAAELAARLARRAESLVRELLPAGQREGEEWRCGGVAGERGRSLSVRLRGDKAGVWADFASGEGGDALDLVAAVRCRGDCRQAMDWAREWLGGAHAAAPAARLASSGVPLATLPPGDAPATERVTAAARGIFFGARATLSGTPVAAYLLARGIDLAELPRQPWALRYDPALWCQEARGKLPAMVAAVAALDGSITAVHRTWLARDAAGIWRKARLRNAKKSLGPVAGSFIRLARGASGKALAQAPDGEPVVIAEGIETGLSIAVACPERRVLCAVSLANMGQLQLPPGLRQVILAADNDGDNPAAMRGLRRAMSTLAERGHAVRVARSPLGKDFNDALLADAMAGAA